MNSTYVSPQIDIKSYHCPFCGVLSLQRWGFISHPAGGRYADNFKVAGCDHCDKLTLWYEGRMVFPYSSNAPTAVEDMPEDVKEVFDEARTLVNLSPRAAVALLRLALQLLLPHLGGKGRNIDDDIGILVKNGLSTSVQQALDAVRVVGNNAVHPGVIDLKDDQETAGILFNLLNFVVTEMVTRPKQLQAFYSSLPQSSLDAIKKRDGTS